MSGRRDSNPRPPAPKAGALTGLRYAPYYLEIVFYLKSDAKVLLFFIPTKPFAKNISFLTNCRAQSQVSNFDKLSNSYAPRTQANLGATRPRVGIC